MIRQARLAIPVALLAGGGVIALLRVATPHQGQHPVAAPPPGRIVGYPPPRAEIAAQFDADKDGKLDRSERSRAREAIRAGGPGRFGPFGLRRITQPVPDAVPTAASQPPPGTGLYDESHLRTLSLRFEDQDWYEELADFYLTDVQVPADLTVDGVTYPAVGVRFRGKSSYFTIGDSEKRSFNISLASAEDGRRLLGHRTLNLLNCHADPTFVREVLYLRICRDYTPAFKANFVKLVVNGESWGVYANVEQFDGDFLREWYGSRTGTRWKVPGRQMAAGLTWLGPGLEAYQRAYAVKGGGTPEAWAALAGVCKVLAEASPAEVEQALSPIFDVDQALWYLALENIFMDNDGYVAKTSDYSLYRDGSVGRIHCLQHDGSEVFGISGPEWTGEPTLDPLVHADDEEWPAIHRLLAAPSLRARYIAHLRTIVDEWLDWKVIGPVVARFQSLIEKEVKADGKKLFSHEDFVRNRDDDIVRGRLRIKGLRCFVEERRAFLLAQPDLARAAPSIRSVRRSGAEQEDQPVSPGKAVRVEAELAGDVAADVAYIYYSLRKATPFQRLPMREEGASKRASSGTRILVADIPPQPAGTLVRYYVEVRGAPHGGEAGGSFATAFLPARAEQGALSYRVHGRHVVKAPVVINEVMARKAPPPGEAESAGVDWIEVENVSGAEVDLGGMYLSDNEDHPRKWAFPQGTKLAPGHRLIVSADKAGEPGSGLHAGFKLPQEGGVVVLSDADGRQNGVLDRVTFGADEPGFSHARIPDGTGELARAVPTPGAVNIAASVREK